ncbi:MAG: nucleotidyltransferase [Nonlabens sp.]|uniref:nucleotidyltransferase domain-containing protein n=1 Tax=Nonlabens sp. TaxID=1888209 RepID=UPI00321B9AA1
MGTLLQKEFFKFHDAIKLHDKEDNQELREERDKLTEELKDYFEKKADDEGSSKITFSIENQGSYSMGTGIKALTNNDYDIDVMTLFNISRDDYSPITIKQWVYEALDKKGRTISLKYPCVTVHYFKDEEEIFHIDLALYAAQNDDEKKYIAKGKPTSASDKKIWELSEPKLLKSKIFSKFNDSDERAQMKRAIRYLKRWKDFKFKASANGKPTGIAITALAYELFKPEIAKNSFNSSIEIKDLVALKNLVESIINRFSFWTGKISVELPVEPYNDLFAKMSDGQHIELKKHLEDLKDSLQSAYDEADPHEASLILIKEFGDDFPEIDKDKTAQKRAIAFPGKSESA